jgi:hypothetical protein
VIYVSIKGMECAWRNVVPPAPRNFQCLEDMMLDAIALSIKNFKLLYGGDTYVYYAPDNSLRVCCQLPLPAPQPWVKPNAMEHSTGPRRGDLVAIVINSETFYGKINWVNKADDVACVYMFLSKDADTIGLDQFESQSGRVRWRIYQ